MAKTVLLNCRMFTGGIDLSGNSNKIEIDGIEREKKDTTNYRSAGWTECIGGLGSGDMAGAGQWESSTAAPVDSNLFAGLGVKVPWTVSPVDDTVGSLAYVMGGVQGDYKIVGGIGDVAGWAASAVSSSGIGRGQIAHPPGTARTTSGSGTSLQLGAVATGKQLVATLHVLSVSGTTPSLTARIESDDNSGFTSATTQATFTAASAAGGQVLTVNGPVTDDWFRIAWTISGTTPSFLFVVGIGLT